ncbi:hypothetical protein BGX24_012054 [Mortierella sp. AD032]|nr:hypothetical protein BGX24_012054 [Mortierella sp. AD032]
MGYVSLGEKALIVHGGHTDRSGATDINSNQMFILDLTRSWTTASPAWSDIRSINSPVIAWHSLSLSRNQDQLFLWDSITGFFFYTYDIKTLTWSTSGSPLSQAYKANGLRSVVDPSDGWVYVPSALQDGTQMFRANVAASASNVAPMPTGLPTPLAYYTFVWSTQRSAALLYGGHTNGDNRPNPELRLYSNGDWTTLPTTGTSPGDVSSHCMVPAYNGTRMVVFGGSNINEVSTSNIFFLDLRTMVWTAGTPADQKYARCNMACTVNGDNLIVWGGDSNRIVLDGTPLIYNMKSNQWVTQYTPYVPPNNDGGSSATPGSGSLPIPTGPVQTTPTAPPGPNVGVIAGGAAGAVILGLLIGFFFYRRRKQVNYNKAGSESSPDTALMTITSPTHRSDIESPPTSAGHSSPQPPPSSPPPPLRVPHPVTDQREYMTMQPLVSDETAVSFGNNPHSIYGSGDQYSPRNPQEQGFCVDHSVAGTDMKVPYGESDSHRDSMISGPRNPQQYQPTITKRPNDPQYQPRSPTELSPDYAVYWQRPQDPQGDGTTHTHHSIIYNGVNSRNSTTDAERLKEELAQMEAQSLELERKRKENQERLRMLLETEGRS